MLRKIFALLAVSFLLHGCGGGGGESESGVDSSMYKKTIDVFGVQVKGTAAVPDDKLLYAAKIMAEYLDQNKNGVADNPLVTSTLKAKGACLGMTAGEEPEGCQSLYVSETIPDLLPGPNAAFEEILHVISESGYAHAYPSVFGESKGTSIADAMDTARGGYQGGGQPVSAYPAGAWYTYNDTTCDYTCMGYGVLLLGININDGCAGTQML